MIVSADRINELKAAVKAECLRRAYVSSTSGSKSMTSYGGTAYDFNVTPAKGVVVKTEHREKNLVPLRAINPETLAVENLKVLSDEEITAMETFVTLCEGQAIVDTNAANNRCAGGCTGMCYSTCTGGCVGSCTGSCSTGCTSCTGSCSTTCRGCSGSCTGDCDGTCSGTCSGGCSGSCSGSCSGAACGAACESYCASNGCFGQTCMVSCKGGYTCRGTTTGHIET